MCAGLHHSHVAAGVPELDVRKGTWLVVHEMPVPVPVPVLPHVLSQRRMAVSRAAALHLLSQMPVSCRALATLRVPPWQMASHVVQAKVSRVRVRVQVLECPSVLYRVSGAAAEHASPSVADWQAAVHSYPPPSARPQL